MPQEYKNRKLLICEGKTDVEFFRRLLSKRNLSGFDLVDSRFDGNEGGGNDKFSHRLRALRLQEDFISNVKIVVLVADNDDTSSFARVCEQLSDISVKPPESPLQLVKFDQDIQLCILMTPPDEAGCLETLCVKSALNKWPDLKEPLLAYKSASPANSWPATKQAKMEMQCLLAATCKKRPDVTLGYLWQTPQEFHFSLNDAVFDPVVNFLRTL